MRVQCSYCQIIFNVKDPFDIDEVSHGVCDECWPWLEHNLKIEIERIESKNRSLRDARKLKPEVGSVESESISHCVGDVHDINSEFSSNQESHAGVRRS